MTLEHLSPLQLPSQHPEGTVQISTELASSADDIDLKPCFSQGGSKAGAAAERSFTCYLHLCS